MSGEAVELDIRHTAAQWAFIRRIETVDKTDFTVKIRLHIDVETFVQIYANTQKDLTSYTLVLNRTRIFGRDSEGGQWHRHPVEAPDQHDFSPKGQRPITLFEFLAEVQQILQEKGLL